MEKAQIQEDKKKKMTDIHFSLPLPSGKKIKFLVISVLSWVPPETDLEMRVHMNMFNKKFSQETLVEK